ncbi:MAG TPA: class I SAM-dependent methyltransferase [Gaiellales bacterium]|jgi:SAM-dependent methyltransferase
MMVRGGAVDRREGAVASYTAIGYLIAIGLIVDIVALTPFVDHVTKVGAWLHLTQHGAIFIASIAIAAGLRDLTRAAPWSAPVWILVGTVGAFGGFLALTPPLYDDVALGSLRSAEHFALILMAAAIGVALRDARLTHSAKGTRMKVYAPEAYVASELDEWIEVGQRQAAKDRVLIPRIASSFVPGRVLELGAGAGQTTLLLRELGWDVVPSDFADFFVDHLEQIGLPALHVDATDIAAAGLEAFPNIFCQSITPLITSDVNIVGRSYRSILEALEPGGRLVEIHAMAGRHELRATMRMHRAEAEKAGFENVRIVRNQLLPSIAYREPMTPFASLAERVFGRFLGDRFVLIADAP